MTINNKLLEKENDELISHFESQVFRRDDLNIETLVGDASTRRYFRVSSNDPDFRSVIVMVSGKKDCEDINSHVESYDYFMKIGFPVPELIKSVPDEGYIIEEDVGDTSLELYMNSGGETADFYSYYVKAIDGIVLLQNSFDNAGIVSSFSHSLPLRNRFTEKKFIEELEMFYDYFFIRYHKMDIPEHDDIKNIFYQITEEILSEVLVPTHRDYHSRNLFIKSNKLYVLDFQDARLGPAHYDLVSLIYDPYIRLTGATQKRLFNEYKSKVYLSRYSTFIKNFERQCTICALQRLLKAIGTYSYMYLKRHNSFYLQFISNALRDINILIDDKDEFKPLADNLKIVAKKEWGR